MMCRMGYDEDIMCVVEHSSPNDVVTLSQILPRSMIIAILSRFLQPVTSRHNFLEKLAMVL